MNLSFRFARNFTNLLFGFLPCLCLCSEFGDAAANDSTIAPPPPVPGCVRVATFNVALNRKENGQLVRELIAGDEQAKRIAMIVQMVAPDILLANEVDYSDGEAAKLLCEKYFLVPQSSALKSSQLKPQASALVRANSYSVSY